MCKNKRKYGKRVCEEIMRLKQVRVYAELNIKEVANMLGYLEVVTTLGKENMTLFL